MKSNLIPALEGNIVSKKEKNKIIREMVDFMETLPGNLLPESLLYIIATLIISLTVLIGGVDELGQYLDSQNIVTIDPSLKGDALLKNLLVQVSSNPYAVFSMVMNLSSNQVNLDTFDFDHASYGITFSVNDSQGMSQDYGYIVLEKDKTNGFIKTTYFDISGKKVNGAKALYNAVNDASKVGNSFSTMVYMYDNKEKEVDMDPTSADFKTLDIIFKNAFHKGLDYNSPLHLRLLPEEGNYVRTDLIELTQDNSNEVYTIEVSFYWSSDPKEKNLVHVDEYRLSNNNSSSGFVYSNSPTDATFQIVNQPLLDVLKPVLRSR